MDTVNLGGKKIGVVTAAYITTETHFLFAAQTMLSLFSLKSSHALYPVVTVNACSTGPSHLDWFKQSFDLFLINDRNNLARAWNRGINACLEASCDYILVINLDLTFHPLFLDNLIAFAAARPDALIWSGTPWGEQSSLEQAPLTGEAATDFDASCFLCDRRLIETVGYFDEQFEPAYHEDKDMIYRIKIAGCATLSTPSARYFHLGQVTLKGAIGQGQEEFLATTRRLMDESMLR
ncbi:MAG: hypothetical protein EBZ48_07090, partial [Proteobacteria bacterium]|nr:hypothetical protein [Pseudomonadota bacterium]